MSEKSLSEAAQALRLMDQGMEVSVQIINYLESQGIPLKVAVIGCGIAFASGSGALGVSRESAIDLFDVIFKRQGIPRETH